MHARSPAVPSSTADLKTLSEEKQPLIDKPAAMVADGPSTAHPLLAGGDACACSKAAQSTDPSCPGAKLFQCTCMSHCSLAAGFYCAANIVVAACIVFANKWVFSYYNFHFVFALTWIHTVRGLRGVIKF